MRLPASRAVAFTLSSHQQTKNNFYTTWHYSIWYNTHQRRKISGADVAKGLDAVFARESRAFISTYGRLTTVQANVLKGLAEPNHCKLFSGEFMETYGIRNVGSISKALKRLVADEIIYEFGGEYLFENPFFREWVRRR